MNLRSRNVALLAIAAWLMFGPLGVAATPREIHDEVMRQRAALGDITIEWTAEQTVDALGERAGLMEGTFVIESGANVSAGSRRYARIEAVSINEGRRVKTNETAVYDGRECRVRHNNMFNIQKEPSTTLDWNGYLSGLWWPLTPQMRAYAQTPEGARSFFPHCLTASSWKPATTENVGSVPCVLLVRVDGLQRIWLNRSKAYCLVRIATERPAETVASIVSEYSDPKQFKPGIWLPRKIVKTIVALDPRTAKEAGTTTVTVHARILKPGAVDPKVFRLEPRPGETVVDSVRSTHYVYADPKQNTLEDSVARATRVEERLRAAGQGRTAILWTLAICCACLLVVIARRLSTGGSAHAS